MSRKKIRVITGKIGPDDQDRGIILVSQALRDAGMEVVYLGNGQSINGTIKSAQDEDADIIGLSFHCGGYIETMRKFMNQLREQGLDHVLVIVGGSILVDDIPKLKEIGVSEIFIPGTRMMDIVNYISENVTERRL